MDGSYYSEQVQEDPFMIQPEFPEEPVYYLEDYGDQQQPVYQAAYQQPGYGYFPVQQNANPGVVQQQPFPLAPPRNPLMQTRRTRTRFVHVHSVDRNHESYPTAGRFAVLLQDDIVGIVGAKITQAKIPLTDQAVNSRNRSIVFSTSGAKVTARNEVLVQKGSYNGPELSREIMIQINLSIHSAGGTFMNYDSGLAYDSADFAVLADYNVLVSHYPPSDRFVFQVINSDREAVNTVILHLYGKVVETGNYTAQATDLFDVLGFSRSDLLDYGYLDAGTGLYELATDVVYPSDTFGGSASTVDARFQYSLYSSVACNTRTAEHVVVSIEALETDDVAHLAPGAIVRSYQNSMMGKIYLNDASATQEPAAEMQTNMAHLISKEYQTSSQRTLRSFLVTMYRPDGTVFDFNGADLSFTLVLEQLDPGASDITNTTTLDFQNIAAVAAR